MRKVVAISRSGMTITGSLLLLPFRMLTRFGGSGPPVHAVRG
jgi:hypothetical protein